MAVHVRVGRRMDAPKRKGEGRKPARAGKTKQEAHAEIIAKRAGRKKNNG